MARINQEILDELVEDCSEGNDEYVVSKWIIEKVPAIFNGNFEQFVKVKLTIAKQLGIDSCSVVFVGSSCTGFSMNPTKNFKVFDEKSDIDIAIVSYYYFNVAWRWLRQQDATLLRGSVKKAYTSHRNFYVFDGTIATDKILKFLPFGTVWKNVIDELKENPIFNGRDIHFRLYQDHKALVDYHVKNIKNNIPQLLNVKPQNTLLKVDNYG